MNLSGGDRHLGNCPRKQKEQPISQSCERSAARYALRYLLCLTARTGGGSSGFTLHSLFFLWEIQRGRRLKILP